LVPQDGVFDHKGYTEKALNKMIKAKAKADRVAARAAQKDSKENVAISSVQPPPGDLALPPDVSMLTEASSLETTNEGEETNVTVTSAKEAAPDRIELLRSKPQVVGRFMKLMVPVLIDVYAASVVTPVRLKTLTGLLKAVGFLEGENLKSVFTVRLHMNFLLSLIDTL
jgi:E3 ubiquitin-protein ligase TRIP12